MATTTTTSTFHCKCIIPTLGKSLAGSFCCITCDTVTPVIESQSPLLKFPVRRLPCNREEIFTSLDALKREAQNEHLSRDQHINIKTRMTVLIGELKLITEREYITTIETAMRNKIRMEKLKPLEEEYKRKKREIIEQIDYEFEVPLVAFVNGIGRVNKPLPTPTSSDHDHQEKERSRKHREEKRKSSAFSYV